MSTKKAVRMIERAVRQTMRSMGRRNVGYGAEKTLKKLVDVSHLVVVDPSRASRMVMNAVKAGYVERIISQDDARQTYVVLTPKGKNFAVGLRQMRRRHFMMRLQGWSQEDCESFARLLTRFAHGERQQKPRNGRRAVKEPSAAGGNTLVVFQPMLRRQAQG
jgi:DNA-binding MarR family transcriptional regulator